jgi:phospholipase/carboxylesterase
MKHIYKIGKKDVTLLLLHGTGGNENDLLPIAELIDPDANVLSVRGNVLEYGMPRFFKRLAMGVFDMESLVEETHHLYQFINNMSQTYGFDMNNLVGVGYSNGANILLSILLHYDNPIKLALLFHPMIPIKDIKLNDLSQSNIFITSSKYDQMLPKNDTEELEKMLSLRKATTKIYWTNQGHQLTKEEILESKDHYISWLENQLYSS